MSLFNKITNRPIICKVEISYDGNLSPKIINTNQPFFDTNAIDVDFQDVYFGKGSVHFSENSSKSKAGIYYTQNLKFSYSSNDDKRAQRIYEFAKIKYITFNLDDGRRMIFGRNDYKQNKKLSPKFKSNLLKTEVSFKVQSIFPIGFL